MENIPNFANTQMVVGVPYKLRKWWENIKMEHGAKIRRYLGFLTSLIYISPDRHVVKALIKFWDPDRVVFKFKDFELTLTIEEIAGFTDLKYQGRGMILPHKQSGKKFLHHLGLRNNLKLACFDREWVSLDLLYERFGRKDGHEVFHKEFSCSAGSWRKKCPIAFAIALLGTLVFPLEHGKINTCISSIVRAVSRGVDNAELTLVPIIVAEILRALSKCARGRRFFEGCNILLQLWAVEHFYKRPAMVDILMGKLNKIDSHQQRMIRFVSPVGTNDWYAYMRVLTGSQIQWRYSWLSPRVAVIRGHGLYYIELIGLKGIQPYGPIRVLRQFGRPQIIPLRSHMDRSEYDFGALY